MKLSAIIISLLLSLTLGAKDFEVRGPEGGLAMKLTLPEDFDQESDSCPMVILMHGIFSSKDFLPMPELSKSLAQNGIASIRFDFNGHGKSEGRMQDMTVEKEIADAIAMWEYARTLPYVSKIALLGHSQGGVIASMTAGRLEQRGESPAALVLLAPGSVIKDACKGGRFFQAEFDPADPPEFIKCFGVMKLGREYLLSTQQLDIYGTAKHYTGPVRLIHGSEDEIVPMWCSERFVETYGDKAELIIVDNENHMLSKKTKETVGHAVSFFCSVLK